MAVVVALVVVVVVVAVVVVVGGVVVVVACCLLLLVVGVVVVVVAIYPCRHCNKCADRGLGLIEMPKAKVKKESLPRSKPFLTCWEFYRCRTNRLFQIPVVTENALRCVPP